MLTACIVAPPSLGVILCKMIWGAQARMKQTANGSVRFLTATILRNCIDQKSIKKYPLYRNFQTSVPLLVSGEHEMLNVSKERRSTQMMTYNKRSPLAMHDFAFTKHCLERMHERQISREDIEYVLQKGFFTHFPWNHTYKAEYGQIVIIIGYDGQLITTYLVSSEEKITSNECRSELKWKRCRHKRENLKIAEFDREIKYA